MMAKLHDGMNVAVVPKAKMGNALILKAATLEALKAAKLETFIWFKSPVFQ